jgi:hypothetical protein
MVDGVASPASWSGGVVFANAVKNAKVPASQPVTTADVIKGLSMIQNSTNGGYTPPVSYGNGTTPSKQVNCFWIYTVKKSSYVSGPNGSTHPVSPPLTWPASDPLVGSNTSHTDRIQSA